MTSSCKQHGVLLRNSKKIDDHLSLISDHLCTCYHLILRQYSDKLYVIRFDADRECNSRVKVTAGKWVLAPNSADAEPWMFAVVERFIEKEKEKENGHNE